MRVTDNCLKRQKTKTGKERPRRRKGEEEEEGMGRKKEHKTRRKHSCYLSDLAGEKIC